MPRGSPRSYIRPMGERPTVDLLAWFSDDERQGCWVRHERALVTIPEALADFCLACGTITIEGVPIKVEQPARMREERQILK